MSDTVSAARFWLLGDARMNFLAPADAPSPPEMGSLHIAGGTYSTYASPSLVVEFGTASPDFQAPGPSTASDPAPPTVSSYAAGANDELRPVAIVGALHIT
jgi:hypothetical protein